MKTKIDLILDAFTEMRINGLTVEPDNEDIKLAIYRLEDLMHELTIDIKYNFESSPDINSISGIPTFANFAVASALALRLAPVYGKLPETFITQASAAMSRLLARVANPPRVPYPTRQPMGRGNEFRYPCFPFFPPSNTAPMQVETKIIEKNDKQTFTFDFTPYFSAGESIANYTAIAQSSGVTISSQSLLGNVITLVVTANTDGWQVISFKVTGTSGTIINRDMNFNVVDGLAIGANQ